jgi:ferrous iron transport protein A
MNKVTLNLLQPGEFGIVENIISTDFRLKMRLLELGLLKGTTIELIRFAPLGDPIEIKIRGYRLSIRKLEAESVIISKNK